jgi:hypothetical protein
MKVNVENKQRESIQANRQSVESCWGITPNPVGNKVIG